MPTIRFSDRGGDTGGDHKDNYLFEDNVDRARGANATLVVKQLAAVGRVPVGRWSLAGHIPTNARVSSAVMWYYFSAVTSAGTASIHRMTTNWGVTNVDAGANQDPAAGGQSTFRRSFDYNGAGGDVTWAGGNFAAADYDATSESTSAITGVGWVSWSIPLMVQNWVQNDATNFGWTMISTDIQPGNAVMQSMDSATANQRPYLDVTYHVPVLKSAIGIGIAISPSI